MDLVSAEWEKRSQDYGEKIEGVMLKSLPREVNVYLHNWMKKQVFCAMDKKQKLKVLDIGCGYGRLSKEILENFPKSKTVGVDVSQTFVNIYNKNLKPKGKAMVGDIKNLPFGNDMFDVVIIVTTFLYVIGKKEQEKCLRKIFDIVKPGGTFVIIDVNTKGYSYITLGGLAARIRGDKDYKIPTHTFDYRYLTSLIEKSGGEITSVEGVPVSTIFLPVLIILGMVSKGLVSIVLKGIAGLDSRLSKIVGPSVYVSIIGKIRE